MPTNTTNFSLIKPGQEEFYNVDVTNNNMDTIDGVLKALQDAINSGASEQDLTILRDALATHLADNVKHITAEERTSWNGKAPASHTHTISQVTGLQTALDSKVNESTRNKPNGFAGLDGSGKLSATIVPDSVKGTFVKIAEANFASNPTHIYSVSNLKRFRKILIKFVNVVSNYANGLDIQVHDRSTGENRWLYDVTYDNTSIGYASMLSIIRNLRSTHAISGYLSIDNELLLADAVYGTGTPTGFADRNGAMKPSLIPVDSLEFLFYNGTGYIMTSGKIEVWGLE